MKALTYKKSYRPIFINQLFLNIFRCFFHYQYEHHVVLLISSLAQWFGRYGSIHPEVFCKKVFKGFTKVARKHRCQSLFFKKSCSLRPVALLIKRFWDWFFPVIFAKFFRTRFFRIPQVAGSKVINGYWILLNINFLKRKFCSKIPSLQK